jgi:hypothetical protein
MEPIHFAAAADHFGQYKRFELGVPVPIWVVYDHERIAFYPCSFTIYVTRVYKI